MIAYFDTSSVVPLLVEEPASAMCGRLWDEATRVVSARILYVEARAALAQATRQDRLAAKGLVRAVRDLDRTVEQIDHVEVTAGFVREAGAIAERHGLRAYDSVHLTAALAIADDDTVFVVGDRDLANAAQAMGLAVAQTS